MYFDVWKYEQDSIRRQFLIELDKQVFNDRLKYKEKLNQSLSRPEKLGFWRHNWEILKNIATRILWTAIISILLLSILWIYLKITDTEDLANLLTSMSQLGILSAFIVVLGGLWGIIISFILESINITRGSVQEHRTDSAEGFESYFKKAFQEKELKDQTLFIVIDNLDRVEESRVISVLSDVKTFLTDDSSKQKVVFLIPCDYESLRARLRKKYGGNFNVDEFFRKFFNMSIRIPKFVDIDLFTYIQDLLKQTKIKEYQNNPDLQEVIYVALKDNPREIKQFINSLTTQVLLARERDLQVVLKNVAFLSKLLVIRQKFPNIYSILEEESIRSLTVLDGSFISRLRSDNNSPEEKARIEKLKNFNDLTSSIQ